MDPGERPRQEDFACRIGAAFSVLTPEGGVAELWQLESCIALEKPALPSLAEVDCFALEFSCPTTTEWAQGTYELGTEDGFKVTLFAVPVANNRVRVTIN